MTPWKGSPLNRSPGREATFKGSSSRNGTEPLDGWIDRANSYTSTRLVPFNVPLAYHVAGYSPQDGSILLEQTEVSCAPVSRSIFSVNGRAGTGNGGGAPRARELGRKLTCTTAPKVDFANARLGTTAPAMQVPCWRSPSPGTGYGQNENTRQSLPRLGSRALRRPRHRELARTSPRSAGEDVALGCDRPARRAQIPMPFPCSSLPASRMATHTQGGANGVPSEWETRLLTTT